MTNQIDDMKRFYLEVFGLETAYSDLRLPVSRDGFSWLLIADERVTTELAYQIARKRFPCSKYTDCSLDDRIQTNDRDHQSGTYAIWFRDGQEADEIHKGKSSNQAKEEDLICITLCERILLELWYHWKNKQHLDCQNWTLCAGSRGADGDVPFCGWRDGKFKVLWFSSVNASDSLRVREGVS